MREPTSYRTGGGGAGALGGLPFLLFGLGFAGAGVYAGFTEASRAGGPPPIAVLPFVLFGLLFASIGAGIAFGRSGVDLDGSRRTVTSWWSLLGLRLRRTVQKVPDAALVTIEREVRRGNKTTYTVFPVRAGDGERAPALLGEPREHAEARRIAERAGKAFGADVEDRTLDPPSRRRADQLDLSLRRRHKDAPPPAPVKPAAPTCTVRAERRQVSVEVPPAMAGAERLAQAGVGCLGLFMVLPVAFFTLASGASDPLFLVFFAVWMLVALGALRSVLKAAKRAASPTRIEVGRDAVTVAWQDERAELPTEELEEVGFSARSGPVVFVGPADRLLLISDARTIEVPLSLQPDERDWLADLIIHVAATGEAPPDP